MYDNLLKPTFIAASVIVASSLLFSSNVYAQNNDERYKKFFEVPDSYKKDKMELHIFKEYGDKRIADIVGEDGKNKINMTYLLNYKDLEKAYNDPEFLSQRFTDQELKDLMEGQILERKIFKLCTEEAFNADDMNLCYAILSENGVKTHNKFVDIVYKYKLDEKYGIQFRPQR